MRLALDYSPKITFQSRHREFRRLFERDGYVWPSRAARFNRAIANPIGEPVSTDGSTLVLPGMFQSRHRESDRQALAITAWGHPCKTRFNRAIANPIGEPREDLYRLSRISRVSIAPPRIRYGEPSETVKRYPREIFVSIAP